MRNGRRFGRPAEPHTAPAEPTGTTNTTDHDSPIVRTRDSRRSRATTRRLRSTKTRSSSPPSSPSTRPTSVTSSRWSMRASAGWTLVSPVSADGRRRPWLPAQVVVGTPAKLRARSSRPSPLRSSSPRSMTPSAGRRTSTARSAAPVPPLPPRRSRPKTRLSSRKTRVTSSSSATRTRASGPVAVGSARGSRRSPLQGWCARRAVRGRHARARRRR
jgi:hypothetical protein